MAKNYSAAVIPVGLGFPLQPWGTNLEAILEVWKVQETDTEAVTEGSKRETGELQGTWQPSGYACFQKIQTKAITIGKKF